MLLSIAYPTKKLHADKTVRATVQRAGYFTAIWRTKFATNEYLFLIGQLSRNDFECERSRTQILDLRDQGVSLNIYSYNEICVFFGTRSATSTAMI